MKSACGTQKEAQANKKRDRYCFKRPQKFNIYGWHLNNCHEQDGVNQVGRCFPVQADLLQLLLISRRKEKFMFFFSVMKSACGAQKEAQADEKRDKNWFKKPQKFNIHGWHLKNCHGQDGVNQVVRCFPVSAFHDLSSHLLDHNCLPHSMLKEMEKKGVLAHVLAFFQNSRMWCMFFSLSQPFKIVTWTRKIVKT